MKKNRKRTLFVLQGKLWNLAQHVSQAAWLQLCMLLSLIASATFKKYGSCNPSPLKRFRPEMSEGFTKSELKPVCPSPWHKKHTGKKALTSIPQKREEHTPVTTGTDFFCQPSNQRSTKVFKNLVSNCSTYFGYSEELAAPWPLQNVSERNCLSLCEGNILSQMP